MSLRAATVRHLLAPVWAVKERSPYLQVAAELEREARMDPEQRRERQFARLQSIVAHAARSTTFYAERFRSVGFAPGDLRSWSDLQRLPVLTKTDLREHTEAMRSDTVPAHRLRARHTSGSTGVPVHLVADRDSMQWKRGVALWRDQWTGWRLGEPRGTMYGDPNPGSRPSWRERAWKAVFNPTVDIDTLKLTEASMEQFARDLVASRATLLFGHAHSLALFAAHWASAARPPHRLVGILSTAMVLHPAERDTIESAFGVAVFDRYGCEETSLIASECEAHAGLHVNTDSLVAEIDADDPGSTDGPVLLTDLTNRAMPIIRYAVGDRAEAREGNCPCGRTYPLWNRVTGRIADYLIAPNGMRVSGISLTDNFATLIPGALQVQLVQEVRDHLRIRMVATETFDARSEAKIRELVTLRFGSEMGFTVERVSQIEPEPSGKFRFAICKLPDPEASDPI